MRNRLVVLLGLFASHGALADGASLFNGACSMCHQAGGGGIEGQFPPLRGRVGRIAASPEGRAYLASVVLYGLHGGPIRAQGGTYAGFMPPFAAMNDADLAAILTYAASLGGAGPTIAPADLAAARAHPVTNRAVMEARQKLEASGRVK